MADMLWSPDLDADAPADTNVNAADVATYAMQWIRIVSMLGEGP